MAPFVAKRVTRTFVVRIQARPDRVFPLVCPVREKDWLDGWECELIYSESGFAEKGCVFISTEPDGLGTIWTITTHDREHLEIEFARITPGSRVGLVHLGLTDHRDGTTGMAVCYTYTALADAGNRFIESFTQEHFKDTMRWWERSMNHYLQTGERLSKE